LRQLAAKFASDVTGAFAGEVRACAQKAALLLRGDVGHEPSADQTVCQKICQPCGVVHVGLAAGHVLDVRAVGQNQLKLAVA
jgi:hypothetical protein